MPNPSYSFEEAGLTFSDIFEQIPIKIHNSHIVNAFLGDMQETEATSAHFERLNLSTNPYLEKTLEFLTECLDDLAGEQNKYQYYQKNLAKQHNYMKKVLLCTLFIGFLRYPQNAHRSELGYFTLPPVPSSI